MGLINRMRNLRTLLNLRVGPGAATFPADVKRINLDFARKMEGGHIGARKFWREYLPRLKYHNPAVSMTINRSLDQDGPSALTIYFDRPNGSNTVLNDKTTNYHEVTEIIDMKHKHGSDILKELLEKTNASNVKASAEEESELRQLAEERLKSEEDRVRTRLVLEAKQREKELLERARGMGTGPSTLT